MANILPPMFNLTQSFRDVASGVGARAVTLRLKSPPCSGVLVTEDEDEGGEVVAVVGPLVLSAFSCRSGMEEEVLRVE